MTEPKQKLAALLMGLLLSLALVGGLEGALRLNRTHGWIDVPSLMPPKDGHIPFVEIPDWRGVNKEGLKKVHDPFHEVWEKYGARGFAERTDAAFTELNTGPPHRAYRSIKNAPDGELIFDVLYRYGANERRLTPRQPARPVESIYLVGCSLVLGEGVQENETIGAFLQAGLKKTVVESFGYHGWGIGNHLNFLRQAVPYTEPNPYLELTKLPVTVVYFFIPDHVKRTLCGLSCYQQANEWMLEHPRFQITAEGEVKSVGRFSDPGPLSAIFRAIAGSEIVKQFGLDWPKEDSPEQLNNFFQVLNAYRAELGEKVPIKDFYFVISPPHFPVNERVVELAHENGYKVLDLGKLGLNEMIGGEPRIPFDGHFSPSANYILAHRIIHRILEDHPEIR